jgi:hypothetical protein
MDLNFERTFQRKDEIRQSKKIFIFCEGAKTEPAYFKYFQEMDSRLDIQIFGSMDGEDNTPAGLLTKAESKINELKESNDIEGSDEIWIVFDTEKPENDAQRGNQITTLKCGCNSYGWGAAESNPSFEIWLYYHFHESKPMRDDVQLFTSFKEFVNAKIPGGFDPRKDPKKINLAIVNSKANYNTQSERLMSTNVFLLAESIMVILSEKYHGLFTSS